MWIVDFDCCKSTTFDKAGIHQAAKASYGNDPYFPWETGKGDELWNVFASHFLKRSREALAKSDLPRMMLDRIMDDGRERSEKKQAAKSRSAS